jgi:Xaa-Pro aminopeptidase
VIDAFAGKRRIAGWEVDRGDARARINNAGYAQYFTHRTGHSIGMNVHGNGANMDNLKPRTTARLSRTPASRSSRAFTCRSSACAVK